jgi:hypothetical protein
LKWLGGAATGVRTRYADAIFNENLGLTERKMLGVQGREVGFGIETKCLPERKAIVTTGHTTNCHTRQLSYVYWFLTKIVVK